MVDHMRMITHAYTSSDCSQVLLSLQTHISKGHLLLELHPQLHFHITFKPSHAFTGLMNYSPCRGIANRCINDIVPVRDNRKLKADQKTFFPSVL